MREKLAIAFHAFNRRRLQPDAVQSYCKRGQPDVFEHAGVHGGIANDAAFAHLLAARFE